jgi:RimJ/RimL family protein N-acetyltransferase
MLKFTPASCIIAVLGDRYLGYTYVDPGHSDAGRLQQGWTGVRPEWWRQGIGTALKAHGIAYARRHGYDRIATSTFGHNRASHGLNQKVGFRRR